MKHKSFLYYYLLTFLLLGFIPILSLIFNDGSMNFDQAATRASKETGLEWTSNLLVMIRLILAEPLPEEGLGRAINDRLNRAAAKFK